MQNVLIITASIVAFIKAHFLFQLQVPPDNNIISLSVYKPSLNPFQSCISLGLLSNSLLSGSGSSSFLINKLNMIIMLVYFLQIFVDEELLGV